jgi:outer membrane lipoprotein-sorting protein
MVSFYSYMAQVRTRASWRRIWHFRVVGSYLLFALLVFAAPLHARAQANSLVSSWLTTQTNIHTWSADFIQTRRLKSLAEPLTANGHVWFAEPNRFRWELGSPAQTIAVRASTEMLVIYPRLKRVERYPLTGDQTGQWREALGLLEAGFPRSEAELTARFKIASQAITNQNCELTLEPKSAAARKMMPEIRLAFSTNDFSLQATQLQFADGSTLRNDFGKADLNPQFDPAMFAPKIDPSFKVIEPLKK